MGGRAQRVVECPLPPIELRLRDRYQYGDERAAVAAGRSFHGRADIPHSRLERVRQRHVDRSHSDHARVVALLDRGQDLGQPLLGRASGAPLRAPVQLALQLLDPGGREALRALPAAPQRLEVAKEPPAGGRHPFGFAGERLQRFARRAIHVAGRALPECLGEQPLGVGQLVVVGDPAQRLAPAVRQLDDSGRARRGGAFGDDRFRHWRWRSCSNAC